MTKKSDLRLDRDPINVQPEQRETPSQRLTKLKMLLAEEQMSKKPCAAYIEDLGLSIIRLQNEERNYLNGWKGQKAY